MRTINLIVIHCSATRADRCLTEHDLRTNHVRRGMDGIGYHFYIRKDGRIVSTRPPEFPGQHTRGHNLHSIGVCYEGGIAPDGQPADTRTEWQRHSLKVLVRALLMDYPGCRICGHRDLSTDRNQNGQIEPEEWVKQCPCFDVAKEF